MLFKAPQCLLILSVTLGILAEQRASAEGSPIQPIPAASAVVWLDEYHSGLDEAHRLHKLALLWFYDAMAAETADALNEAVLSQPSIAAAIPERYIAIKLPSTVRSKSAESEMALLDHPAFVEMQHSPGFAIIDMSDEQSPLFRQVVSVYPFTRGPISSEVLFLLLDLPRGRLSQGTPIFAARA